MRAGFALTVLLLLPLLPASAAPVSVGTCDEVTPCLALPLYLQAGGSGFAGLSALPGDAMQSDASTRYTSSGGATVLTATGPVLETPLTLARAMELRLPDFTARSDVWGNVTVQATTTTGSNITLARVVLTPASHEKPSEKVAREANNAGAVATTLVPSVPSILGPIAEQVSEDAVPRGLASEGLAAANDEACARQPPACDQANGRWGFATIRFCADKSSANLPQRVASTAGWTAQDQLNESGAPVTFCGRGLYEQAQPHATAVDDATPQAGLCDTPVCHLVSLPPLPVLTPQTPPPTSDPQAPRMLRFNATPPEWLAQDASSFTLPTGVRLTLRLDFVARENLERTDGSSPVVFHYGRADVPSALVVSTSTPGAFAMLVKDAESIGPGPHTGSFSNLTDVDVYRVTPPAGARVRITTFGAPIITELLDTHGVRRGESHAALNASEPWTLRVSRSGAAPHTSEHGFVVSYLMPKGAEADETELTDGTLVGSVGPGDGVDEQQIFLWKAQRVDLRLRTVEGDCALRLTHSPTLRVVASDVEDGYHAILESSVSGNSTVSVVRDFGACSYSLDVQRIAGGDLSPVPILTAVPGAPRPRSLGDTYEGGVDYLTNEAGPGSQVVHATPIGAQIVHMAPGGAPWLGRAAGGAVVAMGKEPDGANVVVANRSGTHERLFEPRGAFALGPGEDITMWEDFQIVRLHPNRTKTVVTNTSDHPERLFFDPAGNLYVVGFFGAFVVEPSGARVAIPANLQGLRAFDGEGNGYVVRYDTLLQKIDLATGAIETVAQTNGARILDARVADGRVYAMVESFGAAALVWAPTATVGWGGYRPALEMAALPDVVATRVEDRVVGLAIDPDTRGPREVHEVTVFLENRGEGPMPAFLVDLRVLCGVGCPQASMNRVQAHAGLAADAEGTVTFRIEFERDVGDVRYGAIANPSVAPGSRPMESSFEWMPTWGSGFVIVGGNQRFCEEQTDLGNCASL